MPTGSQPAMHIQRAGAAKIELMSSEYNETNLTG